MLLNFNEKELKRKYWPLGDIARYCHIPDTFIRAYVYDYFI